MSWSLPNKEFRWKAGFWMVASPLLLGVGCLFHSVLVPVLAPGLEEVYKNRALFRSLEGWPGAYMFAHPLVYGVPFAAAFRLVGGVQRCRTWGRGLLVGSCFGTAVFVIGSLPVYLLNYASFAVPLPVILSWIAQSASQYVVAGAGLGSYSAFGHVSGALAETGAGAAAAMPAPESRETGAPSV